MVLSRRTGFLLVLAFIVSLPAVTPRIYAADEIEYFSFLRSLWFDHDLSFDNEYRHFADDAALRLPGFRETFLADPTPTGHRKTFATIGCALLWAPFYGAADLGVRVARLAGADVAADGYSRPYVAAVAYGSALYGLLALLLSVHACKTIFAHGNGETTQAKSSDPTPSAAEEDAARSFSLASFAVWLGTPLLFYMYVAPPFAHAASAFTVSAFVATWLHVRRQWSAAGMVALGALAALMTMVREQDAFFIGGVALDFGWTVLARVHGRTAPAAIARLLANATLGALAGLVAFIPQAIAYVVINGSLRPSPHVTRKMTWTAPHAWQVLASPENGLIFWTPIAALALAGVVLLAVKGGRGTRIGICLLVMALLQVYVCGAIESWTVMGAFGQRRFVGLTPVLVVGLATLALSMRATVTRRVLAVVLVLCAWWNIALTVQFGAGMMDRQRLTLGSNAYNAFVVVPREIPRMVYRYAFNRASFYATPAGAVRPE